METIIRALDLEPRMLDIALSTLKGGRISDADALYLFESAPLALLGMLATNRKQAASGKTVYYNRNIHIEPTNICLFNCKFCSYRRPLGAPDAWYYTLDDIERIARSYIGQPITEVHIVGGVHPHHDLEYYCQMIRRVKSVLPAVSVKAYTAVELHYIIRKAGLELEQGLQMLQQAGMQAIPGGGAEIFDPEIRAQICPDKPSAQEWLATHRAAHNIGIATNATILFGHIESYAHRIDHLRQLRELQDETHGFDAFIPLKYHSQNNDMSQVGEASLPEQLRMMAIARLYLDNIPHIKAYWPMLGIEETEMALGYGADDIDGTIDDTTKIYSMAGSEIQKPQLTTPQMEALIRRAGYEPCERDTFYNPVK